MKNLIYTFILLIFPIGAFAQWNTDLNANLQIASNGGNLYNLYSNNGYFFCYDENTEYKIHRYNTDGTPNWASAMLPNNRPVGSATFTKYAFLDNLGNLIHISSFDSNGSIRYCINKISTNGDQLWNGSSGIEIDNMVIGAYLSPNNDLYIAKSDKTLQKYNNMGVLQWSTIFDDSTLTGYVMNVSISEKADGSIGVVFLKPESISYGNYCYSGISNNGTFLSTVQIETELCSFNSPYKLLTDNNDLYFLFTDQTDKAHIQKLTNNTPVFPDNGFDIDTSVTHASIYQSAIIKNGGLNILYHYFENYNGPIGILSQTIDLASFTRSYPEGNILINCNNDDVFTIQNGMNTHDNNFGFLVLDKNTKNLSYKVFDGNAIVKSYDICTTSSEKGIPAVSTLNNINSTNSQVVVLFTDDRNNDYESELYAQNLLFGFLKNKDVIENKQVQIYPNPVRSTLFISSDEALKNIEIYNINGQLISTISNEKKIDMLNWQKGTYILKIITKNNQTFLKKIIKE